MGKSNKFDFSNRPSSGPKLGKSIFHTLQREAEKIRKDREAINPRRFRDSQSRNSPRDNQSREMILHLIDFHANEKRLSDEGITMVTDGLCAVLKEQSALVHVALENLNLAGNQISSKSLSGLADVIRHARDSVKAINLADNSIVVVTDAEVQDFEAFFRACCQCVRLQRLDFSGNVLGPRAFERLAQIYQTMTHTATGLNSRSCSATPSLELSISSRESSLSKHSPNTSIDTFDAILRSESEQRRLPTLNFQNTDLTDDSALWLSYIVERPLIPYFGHNLPIYSTDETDLSISRVDADITAIQWNREASSLGKDAHALLKKAELVREKRLAVMRAEADDRSLNNEEDSEADLSHELLDLESIRKKVQRLVLEQYGSGNTDLWHISLSVLDVARKVRYVATKAFQTRLRASEVSSLVLGRLLSTQNEQHKVTKLPDDAIAEEAPASRTVYASLRIVNSNPQLQGGPLAVPRPNGQDKIKKTKHDPSSENGRSDGKFDCYELELANKRRDLMAIIRCILKHILTPQQMDILSSLQLEHAIAWGLSKETLAIEQQWSKHSDSWKTWMLLDSIHGLSYETRDAESGKASRDESDLM